MKNLTRSLLQIRVPHSAFRICLLFCILQSAFRIAIAAPPAATYYPFNGARSAAITSATTVTLSRLGGVSNYVLTLGTSGTTYTAQLVMSDSGIHAGDVYFIPVSYPATSASNAITLQILDSGTGGTLLHSSTSTGVAGQTVLRLVNVSGTSWSYSPEGAVLTRNLGAGVQTALAAVPNTSAGLVTGSGLASGTAGAALMSGTATYGVGGAPLVSTSNWIIASQGYPAAGVPAAVPDSIVTPTGTAGAGLHVGTDDTVALQAQLTYLANNGGGVEVLDGGFAVSGTLFNVNTHPGALGVGSLTTIKGFNYGDGLILSNSSNCTLLYNLGITGSSVTTSHDIAVLGPVTINCNSGAVTGTTSNINGTVSLYANQSCLESGTGIMFNCGVWFGGVNGVTMKDFNIINCPTFSIVLSNGSNAYGENVNFIHDYANVLSSDHTDGWHLWSWQGLTVIAGGGDGADDELAFNTNEGIYTGAEGGMEGAYRFPNASTTIVNGNYYVDGFQFRNSGNTVRVYGVPGTAENSVNNLTLLNLSGTANGSPPNNYNTTLAGCIISGWNVHGTGTIPYLSQFINQSSSSGTTTGCFTYNNPTDGNSSTMNCYQENYINAANGNTEMSFVGGSGQIGFLSNRLYMTGGSQAILSMQGYGNFTTQSDGLQWLGNSYALEYSLLYSGTTGVFGDLNLQSTQSSVGATWSFDPSGMIYWNQVVGGTSVVDGGISLLTSNTNNVTLAVQSGTAGAVRSSVTITGSGSGSTWTFPGVISGNGSGLTNVPGPLVVTGTLASGTWTYSNALISGTIHPWVQATGTNATLDAYGRLSVSVSGTTATVTSGNAADTGTFWLFIPTW